MDVVCPNGKSYDIEFEIVNLSKAIEINGRDRYDCSCCEFVHLLKEIETPVRNNGVEWFRNVETVYSILDAFENCGDLPAVQVTTRRLSGTHQYKLKNGFHRYWLSYLVGFKKISVDINNFELSDLD